MLWLSMAQCIITIIMEWYWKRFLFLLLTKVKNFELHWWQVEGTKAIVSHTYFLLHHSSASYWVIRFFPMWLFMISLFCPFPLLLLLWLWWQRTLDLLGCDASWKPQSFLGACICSACSACWQQLLHFAERTFFLVFWYKFYLIHCSIGGKMMC